MKWLVIWTAIIANNPVLVTDEDHPDTFDTVQECADHVQRLTPQINALMKKQVLLADAYAIGECVPIEDERPVAAAGS